jgi:hypothetical protein
MVARMVMIMMETRIIKYTKLITNNHLRIMILHSSMSSNTFRVISNILASMKDFDQ